MSVWFKVLLLILSLYLVPTSVTIAKEYTTQQVLSYMSNDYESKRRPHFVHTHSNLFGSTSHNRDKVMKEISYGTPIQVAPLLEITNDVLNDNEENIDKFITQAAQLKQLRYKNALKELQANGTENDYIIRAIDNQRITRKQMADYSYLNGDLELLKQEALQHLLTPFQTYYTDHFIVPVFFKKKFVGYQFFNPSQSDDYHKTKNYEKVSARNSWKYQSLPFYPFRIDEQKAKDIAKQNDEPILINVSNLQNRPDYGQLFWFFNSSQEFVSLTTGGLYKLTHENNNVIRREDIPIEFKQSTNFAQFYSPATLTTIQPPLYNRAPLKHIFLKHKYLIMSWILLPIGMLINIYSIRQHKRKRRELRF